MASTRTDGGPADQRIIACGMLAHGWGYDRVGEHGIRVYFELDWKGVMPPEEEEKLLRGCIEKTFEIAAKYEGARRISNVAGHTTQNVSLQRLATTIKIQRRPSTRVSLREM